MSKDVSLSLEQIHAVELCADQTNRIVGVTGGAGVGKTLVLGKAYEEVKRRTASVVLCAPTGRAAKRIQELTKIPAMTIHRLLEFPAPDLVYDDEDDAKAPEPVPGQPRRCADYPLKQKVVFVDESSMIGPELYEQLSAALPTDGCIRFFGDNNQLPPVERGKPPFISILNEYPSVTLTYNYRSDDEIVANAQRILDGSIPQNNSRFRILYSENPIKYMLDFVGKEKEFIDDTHQVIMPARKGSVGTIRVNPSLQMRFNPKGPLMRLDRYDEKEAALTIRAKDKFIWVRNDYELKLFNGEIGKIDWIDEDEGALGLHTSEGIITCPPKVRIYDAMRGHMRYYDPRKAIELGYAITTHKAQGSEFEYVIYCMSSGSAFLLNRQNLYTAVTRAKKMVIIIADRKAMGLSMRRARTD